uniref:EndoU domain-containing protein n=1 Tax=Clastoptera arizonana TaxID=38151 RepID=A0A1B6CSC7_9HEMI
MEIISTIFILGFYTCFCTGTVPVTDDELKTFSEALFSKDNSTNGKSYVDVKVQGRTNSGSQRDQAPLPLLSIDNEIKKVPTVAKLIALYDNYDPDTSHSEVVTTSEKKEESDFLDAVLNTSVLAFTNTFLRSKGYTNGTKAEMKDLLYKIWFTIYSRGQKKLGSSAFEHVFMGEIKREEVSGFHNWIYFGHEEDNKHVNYLGYMKILQFQGNGGIMKIHYTWNGKSKPVGTLFVGTSPELELSLYTVCFLIRPNDKCYLRLGGKDIFIQTYTFTLHKEKLIGSAFPGIVQDY